MSRKHARNTGQATGVRASSWDGLAWLLFVLLGLVFFWEVLIGLDGGRRYFWDDFLEFTYPVRYFSASSLASGKVPFWNPYVFAGMPFLADIQSAVFYPLNLALNVVAPDGRPPVLLVEGLAVLHLVLAGCWMFLLVRRLGVNLWGAWVSGVTFMFSGFLVTHVIHLNVLEVAAWLPLSFLMLHLAFTHGSLLHALGAGAVLGVAFLGGSPQIVLLSYIGLGFFTLYMTGRDVRRTGTFVPSWLRIPALGAAAVAFSLFLCLFQLLPSLELSRLSIRPELSYAQSVEASFPPQNLITFFMPRFFGDTSGGDFQSYWGVGRYFYFWEMCGYAGVVGLLMAWIGVRKSERPHRAFLVVLVLLSLLLAAGKYGGIHWLFFQVLPGYDRFRIPSRALMLAVFAVSVLAGYGTEVLVLGGRKSLAPWFRRLGWQWGLFSAGVLAAGALLFGLSGRGGRLPSGETLDWTYFAARALPFVVFSAAAAGVLAIRAGGRLSPRATGAIVLALVAADLFVFGRSHNSGAISLNSYYASGVLVESLKPARGEAPFRVQTRAPGGAMVMRRNQGLIDGVFNIDGYNQLKLSLYQEFDVGADLKLDLLNTRYRMVEAGGGRYTLAEVPGFLPRAFLVPDVEVAGDEEEVLRRMRAESFDPRRTAVVVGPWEWTHDGPAATAEAAVDILSYGPNRIEAEARLDGRAILVFSEIYYPDWQAYVDGARQPIVRADYALRAVPLGPGTHRVVLVYESPAFRRGVWLSGVCLLLGIGAGVVKQIGVRAG